MLISKEKKNNYIKKIHEEMKRRGLTSKEISKIIAKTGFMTAMEKYPEEQMHYDVSDAVNEILLTAVKN